MDLIKLAWEFLQIGLLSYGGGFGVISYIQKVNVQNNWLTLEQFGDMIALSQITPGPIVVNVATYVGYNVAGFAGATVATVAMLAPGFILTMLVIKFFSKYSKATWMQSMLDGLKAVVIGLIISSLVPLGKVAFIGQGHIQWLGIIPLGYSIWAALNKKSILVILGVTGLWGIVMM